MHGAKGEIKEKRYDINERMKKKKIVWTREKEEEEEVGLCVKKASQNIHSNR